MSGLRRCYACSGKKFVFLLGGNSFTQADLGGRKIKCPGCNGEGRVENITQNEDIIGKVEQLETMENGDKGAEKEVKKGRGRPKAQK